MDHAMAAKLPPAYGPNDTRRTGVMLWLVVVSANIIGLFAAMYVSATLRAGVGNPDQLFLFYYGAMLLAGVADAMWLDEVLFKGSFRRSIQGKAGRLGRKQTDIDELAASMQRGFRALLTLCWTGPRLVFETPFAIMPAITTCVFRTL